MPLYASDLIHIIFFENVIHIILAKKKSIKMNLETYKISFLFIFLQ